MQGERQTGREYLLPEVESSGGGWSELWDEIRGNENVVKELVVFLRHLGDGLADEDEPKFGVRETYSEMTAKGLGKLLQKQLQEPDDWKELRVNQQIALADFGMQGGLVAEERREKMKKELAGLASEWKRRRGKIETKPWSEGGKRGPEASLFEQMGGTRQEEKTWWQSKLEKTIWERKHLRTRSEIKRENKENAERLSKTREGVVKQLEATGAVKVEQRDAWQEWKKDKQGPEIMKVGGEEKFLRGRVEIPKKIRLEEVELSWGGRPIKITKDDWRWALANYRTPKGRGLLTGKKEMGGEITTGRLLARVTIERSMLEALKKMTPADVFFTMNGLVEGKERKLAKIEKWARENLGRQEVRMGEVQEKALKTGKWKWLVGGALTGGPFLAGCVGPGKVPVTVESTVAVATMEPTVTVKPTATMTIEPTKERFVGMVGGPKLYFDAINFKNQTGVELNEEDISAFVIEVKEKEFFLAALPPVVEAGSDKLMSEERLFLKIGNEWVELSRNLSEDGETRYWDYGKEKPETVLFYPALEDVLTDPKSQAGFLPPSELASLIPGYSREMGEVTLAEENFPEGVKKALFALEPVMGKGMEARELEGRLKELFPGQKVGFEWSDGGWLISISEGKIEAEFKLEGSELVFGLADGSEVRKPLAELAPLVSEEGDLVWANPGREVNYPETSRYWYDGKIIHWVEVAQIEGETYLVPEPQPGVIPERAKDAMVVDEAVLKYFLIKQLVADRERYDEIGWPKNTYTGFFKISRDVGVALETMDYDSITQSIDDFERLRSCFVRVRGRQGENLFLVGSVSGPRPDDVVYWKDNELISYFIFDPELTKQWYNTINHPQNLWRANPDVFLYLWDRYPPDGYRFSGIMSRLLVNPGSFIESLGRGGYDWVRRIFATEPEFYEDFPETMVEFNQRLLPVRRSWIEKIQKMPLPVLWFARAFTPGYDEAEKIYKNKWWTDD